MEIQKEVSKLARRYPELIELGSGANAPQLAELEQRLGARLPACYRNYLKTFGVIAIGSEEFFGFVGKVASKDFRNVVAAKRDWEKRWQLPENLIPVLDEEGDSLLCLDTATGPVALESANQEIEQHQARIIPVSSAALPGDH